MIDILNIKAHTSENNEITNFWSKSPEKPAVRSFYRAYTTTQFSPSWQLNWVGAEGSKLLPELGSR